jgi:hypothetical protein
VNSGYNEIDIDFQLLNANILSVEFLGSSAKFAIQPDIVTVYSDLTLCASGCGVPIHCKYCQGPNKQRSAYFQIEVDFSGLEDSYMFSFEHIYTEPSATGVYQINAQLIEDPSIVLTTPINIQIVDVSEEIQMNCQKSIISTNQEVICYAQLMTDNTEQSTLTVDTGDSSSPNLILNPLTLVYYGFEIPNALSQPSMSYFHTSVTRNTDFAAYNSEIMIQFGVLESIQVYTHETNQNLTLSVHSYSPNCGIYASYACAEFITNKDSNIEIVSEIKFPLTTAGYNLIDTSSLNLHLEYGSIIRVKVASVVIDLSRSTVFNDEYWCTTASCIKRLYCDQSHCDTPLYQNNRRAYIRFGVGYKHNPKSAQFMFTKSYDISGNYQIKVYANAQTVPLATKLLKVEDKEVKMNLYCQSAEAYFNQNVNCYVMVSSIKPITQININYGDGTSEELNNVSKLVYGNVDLTSSGNELVKSTSNGELAALPNAELLIQQGVLESIEIYASIEGTLEIYVIFLGFLFND